MCASLLFCSLTFFAFFFFCTSYALSFFFLLMFFPHHWLVSLLSLISLFAFVNLSLTWFDTIFMTCSTTVDVVVEGFVSLLFLLHSHYQPFSRVTVVIVSISLLSPHAQNEATLGYDIYDAILDGVNCIYQVCVKTVSFLAIQNSIIYQNTSAAADSHQWHSVFCECTNGISISHSCF